MKPFLLLLIVAACNGGHDDHVAQATAAPATMDHSAHGATVTDHATHAQHATPDAHAQHAQHAAPDPHAQHGGQRGTLPDQPARDAGAPLLKPDPFDTPAPISVAEAAKAAPPPAVAATIYTCPMHPEVTSDKPGTCPKCGMTLVPKK